MIVLAFLAGCEPAPPRVFVTLEESPILLTQLPTIFHPDEPLRADNDLVGVCVKPAEGYELQEDWTLGNGDESSALAAEVTLTNGKTVSLEQFSWSLEFCLHPHGSGPLEAPVEEVRIWSSSPLEAQKVTWESTAK